MSKIINYTKGGFTVTTDKGKINIDTLYNSLHRLYWATNRSKETIVKSIENSLCFSMFKGDKQIGFARVITDNATFAYLCDVYIDEDYRGNGLGIWLLECILNYPDLLELRKWLLATKDAHELYRKFGFSELATPERYMEIVN
ncbi:GNAT family N-acetyltransferase [Clostridium sp. UBA4548]|uniref:GNAT family N-acetyltransferase n=1 Tax=Clostridium sp. UBA4548 TaxID=1946361 RepID=UPI0025C2CB1F|nr:GNAT family N-acetyltransferase [Clostridium sp. UBA4548]